MTNIEAQTVTARQLFDELQEVARTAIRESGDPYFKYENPSDGMQCLYVHDVEGELKPGCLLGRWLLSRGFTLEDLVAPGRCGFSTALARLNYSAVQGEVAGVKLSLDSRALGLGTRAQAMQDQRVPWAEVIREIGKYYGFEVSA